MLTRPVVMLLLVAGLAAGGCGSGSSAAAPPSAPTAPVLNLQGAWSGVWTARRLGLQVEESVSGQLTQNGTNLAGTLVSAHQNRLALSLTLAASSLDGTVTATQEGGGPTCRGTARAGGPASSNEIRLTLREKTGTCDWAEEDEIVLRR